MALPTPNRLKNKKDFDAVFKKGKTTNGTFLFIKVLPTARAQPRFGFIIAAKFSPKAVLRNRVRRLLSGILWPDRLPNMAPCDTVVVVAKKIPEDLSVIQADFLNVLHRARLL